MRTGLFYHHVLEAARQTGRPNEDILKELAAAGASCLSVDDAHYLHDPAAFAQSVARFGFSVEAAAHWVDFRDGYDESAVLPVLDALNEMRAPHLLALPVFPRAERRAHDLAATAEGLARLCESASKRGVAVSLEDFDNALSPCATLQGLQYFLSRAPGLRITFDTGNFIFMEEDARAALKALLPRVALVHVKDRQTKPLAGAKPLITSRGRALYPCSAGGGMIPLQGLLSTLKAAGYAGACVIEHYGSPDMLGYALASLQFVNAAWERAAP